MGDIVRHLLEAGHQRFDPLQHGVEIVRQPIEFVAAASHRQPAAEVALHDPSCGAGHGVDPAQHASRNEHATGEPQHHNDQHRPLRGLGDDAEDAPALFEIATDQQAKAAAQFIDPHQRAMRSFPLLIETMI